MDTHLVVVTFRVMQLPLELLGFSCCLSSSRSRVEEAGGQGNWFWELCEVHVLLLNRAEPEDVVLCVCSCHNCLFALIKKESLWVSETFRLVFNG